jgi:hypothetical protein
MYRIKILTEGPSPLTGLCGKFLSHELLADEGNLPHDLTQ